MKKKQRNEPTLVSNENKKAMLERLAFVSYFQTVKFHNILVVVSLLEANNVKATTSHDDESDADASTPRYPRPLAYTCSTK
jgi:hypothetical protein